MGFCSSGGADNATHAAPCCSLMLPEYTFVSTKNKMKVVLKISDKTTSEVLTSAAHGAGDGRQLCSQGPDG